VPVGFQPITCVNCLLHLWNTIGVLYTYIPRLLDDGNGHHVGLPLGVPTFLVIYCICMIIITLADDDVSLTSILQKKTKKD